MPMAVCLQRPHEIDALVETVSTRVSLVETLVSLPSGEYIVDTNAVNMTPQASTYNML